MKTEDKLAIHELLSRAAHGLDEHDLDCIEKCFAPEASMIVRIAGQDDVGPFEGREAIMKLMADSIAVQTDRRRHIVSNLFFEEEGDTAATVISNLTLFATENGENRLITTGAYRDKVIKVGDDWLITDRDLSLDLPFG
jgi:3-phenylpropionate/cinnamic acid dioxygenase small subunit